MRIRLELSRETLLRLLTKCHRPSDQFSTLISGGISEISRDGHRELIAEILCRLEDAERLLAWAGRNDPESALEIRQSLRPFRVEKKSFPGPSSGRQRVALRS